ncbi:hypothetical protein [Streptomyces sp. IB2014 016-6]|uniref:hypothetical protein n=1 Tax=Streptomyces sp. IB2014 016-6 TaxID=2517818 RepID=UPI0011C77F3B|nr:hypothetical protein [Streptomyces sp. IB2014 016-6]TXL85680.1 hypothetical protein EW053_29840 [Streptomyces sp. IB2014 016-6]
MRAIRAASAALLGAAALALTTPAVAMATAAAPDPPFDFAVTPSVVAAGGEVTLTVTGCSSTATAESGVFDDTPVPSGGSARASVFWDAKPGAMYEVTFICNGEEGTTDLTIAGGTPSPTPSPTVTPTGTVTPTPTVSPTGTTTATPTRTGTTSSTAIAPPGGVKGGLGGSFMGMNGTELAIGTGLVAAATVGTVLVVRRRSANRLH